MSAPRLWKKIDGVNWLTNPRLLLVNPRRKKKRGTTMANPRRRRKNPVNPRRRRRRNPFLPALANRRRTRRRRNPGNGGNGATIDVLGTKFPGAQSLAYGTVGFLGPPFIEAWITPMLPANIRSAAWGRYLIKGGAVVGLVWVGNAMAGRAAALKIANGGGIYLLASLVNDFMPQLTGAAPQPATGYYPRLAARGMGAQPLLGDYGRAGNMTASAPTRLQPQSRY